MLTTEDKVALQELIRSKIDDPIPNAVDSPTRKADCQCSGCGAFITLDGTELNRTDFSLVCGSCARAATSPRRTPVALLKHPLFYVACLTLWALILWVAGWGNGSVTATRRSDAHREWYEKRYPANLVLQVVRAMTRADYLTATGNAAEAARWYTLAREAALTGADEWQGTPAEPLMLLMAANLARQAGDAKGAYAELSDLSKALDAGETGESFRYHRGLCALEVGDVDAARNDLDPFLVIDTNGLGNMEAMFGKSVDRLIRRAETGVDPQENLMLRLTRIAKLDLDKTEMIRGVVNAYLARGVDHPQLDYWTRRTGTDVTTVTKTDGKRSAVGFEDIDEDDD